MIAAKGVTCHWAAGTLTSRDYSGQLTKRKEKKRRRKKKKQYVNRRLQFMENKLGAD
jgi:DNA-binding helix-hairpin-helix protein with protein kinase domain